jgi:hypothetical protein
MSRSNSRPKELNHNCGFLESTAFCLYSTRLCKNAAYLGLGRIRQDSRTLLLQPETRIQEFGFLNLANRMLRVQILR